MSATSDEAGIIDIDPTPSDHEMLERARRIGPTLVAQQAETEERRVYSPETHEIFREAGFLRMLTPKRYGGYETSLLTACRIVREIARGCPSTGWCLGESIKHSVTVGSFFSEQAQDELFA